MKKLNMKQKQEIKKLKNDLKFLANFIDKWCMLKRLGMSLNQYQDYVLVKEIKGKSKMKQYKINVKKLKLMNRKRQQQFEIETKFRIMKLEVFRWFK